VFRLTVEARSMNPIPTAIQEVLDLFEGQLAPVTFGGLETGVLTVAAENVRAAAEALIAVEAAAEAARALLAERQEELAHKAQRALAYARIYAEDDPALLAKVEAIVLPRAGRRSSRDEEPTGLAGNVPPPRRRGRPPRSDANGSLLAPRPRDPALDLAEAAP
jgi:hypothetical protein